MKPPNATQIRVLYALDQRGGVMYWHELSINVRERSGGTVRPNDATRKTMRSRGWLKILEGGFVQITPAGRSAIGRLGGTMRDCPKAPHNDPSGGYLHDADDDQPFDVDGQLYCGRCHYYCNRDGLCERATDQPAPTPQSAVSSPAEPQESKL